MVICYDSNRKQFLLLIGKSQYHCIPLENFKHPVAPLWVHYVHLGTQFGNCGSRTGVSKLQPVGQIRATACFRKQNCIGHRHRSFLYLLSTAAFLLPQNWVVVTETIRPTKLKIFISCPFTEKFANPCPRTGPYSIHLTSLPFTLLTSPYPHSSYSSHSELLSLSSRYNSILEFPSLPFLNLYPLSRSQVIPST